MHRATLAIQISISRVDQELLMHAAKVEWIPNLNSSVNSLSIKARKTFKTTRFKTADLSVAPFDTLQYDTYSVMVICNMCDTVRSCDPGSNRIYGRTLSSWTSLYGLTGRVLTHKD